MSDNLSILQINTRTVLQLSGDCSDRVVCEHISTALDPSSLHRRRNILLRSGGLFVVTLAKWKGGSGMAVITRAPHQKNLI